jgi:hypothetical protein
MDRPEYDAGGQAKCDTNDEGFSWGPIPHFNPVARFDNGSTHLFSSSYPGVEIQIRPHKVAKWPSPFRSLQCCHSFDLTKSKKTHTLW